MLNSSSEPSIKAPCMRAFGMSAKSAAVSWRSILVQMQSRKLAHDSGLVESSLHRRIAIAEPVLHQMSP